MEADTDRDGKISFEEFTKMVENTDISMSMTLGTRSALFFQATVVLQPQPKSHSHGIFVTTSQAISNCPTDQF